MWELLVAFWRTSKLTNFRKIYEFEPSTKSLHSDLDKQYLSIPNKSLLTAKQRVDKNQRTSKITFFVNFDVFFDICLVLSLNVNDIFADTTTSFKIILNDIFMIKLFSDD